MVSVKAYDGTIVRIIESKVKEFEKQQNKIKKLIEQGKTIDEITKLIEDETL